VTLTLALSAPLPPPDPRRPRRLQHRLRILRRAATSAGEAAACSRAVVLFAKNVAPILTGCATSRLRFADEEAGSR
jgi:hypothetical protein